MVVLGNHSDGAERELIQEMQRFSKHHNLMVFSISLGMASLRRILMMKIHSVYRGK